MEVHIKSVAVPFKILEICGLLQTKDSSKAYKAYGSIVHLLAIDGIVFCMFMCLFDVTNIVQLSNLLSIISVYAILSIKSWIFMFQADDALHLMKEIEELIIFSQDSKNSQRLKLKRRTNTVYKVFIFFLSLSLITSTLAALAGLENIEQPPYKLAIQFWFPFDYENNLGLFVAVFAYTFLCSLICCFPNVSINILPSCFLSIISGLLEELNDRLNAIGEDPETAYQELLKCIEIHIRIREVLKKVEKLFSPFYFIEGSFVLIILCTTAFGLSTVSNHQDDAFVIINKISLSAFANR